MGNLESNKLIAEFMGFTIIQGDVYNIPVPKNDVGIGYTPNKMQYHTSWDWLMPVVEKIWDITGSRTLFYHQISEDETLFVNDYQNLSNIEHCYKAAVEFIKWYNNNN